MNSFMQVVFCWLFYWGIIVCKKLKRLITTFHSTVFHGYVYEQETTGFMFLLAAMGMLGFPLTAAFIGIDVLFTYIHIDQTVLIVLLAPA